MRDPLERRAKNNEFIKSQGIICNEDLPCVESSAEVRLKSFDKICERAVAALLIIQIGCDIGNDNYEESMEVIPGFLKKFGVEDKLNSKEKRLIDGTYEMQDAIDVVWEYEAYWSLVWALGLIEDDDLTEAGEVCDGNIAIPLVSDCKDMADFKSRCKLRDIEDILDMLDLFYRYHWATVENRLHPEKEIADLNEEIVTERRRGLEWLVSEEEDWYDISLDT